MARFQKGNKIGKGRPEGSKNKNCMNPVFWYNLIAELSQQTTDERRIAIAFKALELLMPKVNNLPNTPEESTQNANETFLLLKALEQDGSPEPSPAPAGE